MHQLVVFVPESHAEKVKAACFEAGAGRYKNYDCCCFESSGSAQFRALEGAEPFIGSIGKIEKVGELRIEMICEDECIASVCDAIRRTHPYEEPAFHFVALASF